MATRSCPTCGTQYVATVRRCIDCDAGLVDDAGSVDDVEAPPTAAHPEGGGKQVSFALDGWGNQLKVTLEGMLDRAGIPRVWEAGTLVVPATYESAVDVLVATVDGDDVSETDDDRDRVSLEIEGLDADHQADLDARLIASGLTHAWAFDGDLVILAEDEEEILALIDSVFDDEGDEDADPLAAQTALSNLFVAVDRLLKKPADQGLGGAVTAAADRLIGLSVPYGFSTAAWNDLVADGRDLSLLIEAMHLADPVQESAGDDTPDDPPPTEEEVEEFEQSVAEQMAIQARALRDQLVDLV